MLEGSSVKGLIFLNRNRARSAQKTFSVFTEVFCQTLGGLVVVSRTMFAHVNTYRHMQKQPDKRYRENLSNTLKATCRVLPKYV